jgi:hypothetical protein
VRHNFDMADEERISELKQELRRLETIAPFFSEGAISPTQYNRMSSGQKSDYHQAVARRWQVQDELSDLSKSDSQREREKKDKRKKQIEGRLSQIDRHLSDMDHVYVQPRLKAGKKVTPTALRDIEMSKTEKELLETEYRAINPKRGPVGSAVKTLEGMGGYLDRQAGKLLGQNPMNPHQTFDSIAAAKKYARLLEAEGWKTRVTSAWTGGKDKWDVFAEKENPPIRGDEKVAAAAKSLGYSIKWDREHSDWELRRKDGSLVGTYTDRVPMVQAMQADYYARGGKPGDRMRRNAGDDTHSPTSTSSDVRSPTRTATSTETSTDAYTAGNVTVTGGAGAGATNVTLIQRKLPEESRGSVRSKGYAGGAVGTSPGGPTVVNGRRRRRGNPEDDAVAMYEKFHGAPSTQIEDIETEVHYHENLAALGDLVELVVETVSGLEAEIDFEGCNVKLASSEDGTSLYFVGGDQSVDLREMKITGTLAEHDMVIVGDVTNIVYQTAKEFDGMEEIQYTHEFSEEDHGPLPVLRYDTRSRLLYLDGGSYYIPKPMLETSPGITN